jgi:hypothetical protein
VRVTSARQVSVPPDPTATSRRPRQLNRDDASTLHLIWQIELALRMAESLDRFRPGVVVDTAAQTLDEMLAYAEDADLSQEERSPLARLARDIAANLAASGIGMAALHAAPHVLELARSLTN